MTTKTKQPRPPYKRRELSDCPDGFAPLYCNHCVQHDLKVIYEIRNGYCASCASVLSIELESAQYNSEALGNLQSIANITNIDVL